MHTFTYSDLPHTSTTALSHLHNTDRHQSPQTFTAALTHLHSSFLTSPQHLPLHTLAAPRTPLQAPTTPPKQHSYLSRHPLQLHSSTHTSRQLPHFHSSPPTSTATPHNSLLTSGEPHLYIHIHAAPKPPQQLPHMGGSSRFCEA